jgi:hypothetical protein
MNFGELKPGDELYLIDYNQFKIDLTYIQGIVQSIIPAEPNKDNVYQTMMQKQQMSNTITINALFNGIPFPFTVTKDMIIARANDRVVCISKSDVLKEIKMRKLDADNKIKALDRYKKVKEECERVEKELESPQQDFTSREEVSRLNTLETKMEEIIKYIHHEQNKANDEGVGAQGSQTP